jgi:hypothetical protein
MEVYDYFIKNYGDNNDYVFNLIFNFANITDKTD